MSGSTSEWRRKRTASGLCLSCPGKLTWHATLCDACEQRKRRMRRERDRKKNGWSEWKPGSRGRKPID